MIIPDYQRLPAKCAAIESDSFNGAEIVTVRLLLRRHILHTGSAKFVFDHDFCSLAIGRQREAAQALRPLAGNGAYLLFTLGLIGTGMLGVPVLVGSCAYAISEAARWPASLAAKPKQARKFYSVMVVAMTLGLALDFLGLNAVKMLFFSAVVNGMLAPPLILLVIPLTSSRKVMGPRTNPPLLKYLGWVTFVMMTAAAVGMLVTS